MGLFTTKKETHVSSVIYNLAGEQNGRQNYLKSVVLGNMIVGGGASITDAIQGSYLSGPGMKQRSFYRWAQKNYGLIGIPMDTVLGSPKFEPTVVAQALEDDFNIQDASINWIEAGINQAVYWARKYLYENEVYREDWRADYDSNTNEIIIIYDNGDPVVRFTPTDFTINNYIYVSYNLPVEGGGWSKPKLFIYGLSGGSTTLDNQFLTFQLGGRYLPFIPIRHENQFISESYKPEVYKIASKAYKKAFNQDFEDIVEKLADNEQIGEIDFAYVAFGVSVNTKEMVGRKYLYDYFHRMYMNRQVEPFEYIQWRQEMVDYSTGYKAWKDWDRQWGDHQLEIPEDPNSEPVPVGPPEPVRVTTPALPGNEIRIRGGGSTNFDMGISWQSIAETTGSGLGKAGVKKGDLWFTIEGVEDHFIGSYVDEDVDDRIALDDISIWWQHEDNAWKRLRIIGLTHRNYIYNGKYVQITAAQALLDADESGFIVPLHYDTVREMSLVDATQLATISNNLVLNCYQIVKKRWYQRGWFKVFLVIAAIVFTVVTGGAGAGSIGFLGANAAVGASLGFVGVAAVVAGAVANMIAAIIITKLLTMVSVAVLGEKIGFIVAAIASFMTLNVGATLNSGGTMASMWSNFMDPVNLINMTNSVGGGVSSMMASNAQELAQQSQSMMKEYAEQTREIEKLYAEKIGYGSNLFDPMRLTEFSSSFLEPGETFLSRTLMTGSDIAEISMDLVSSFPELTLSTKLPV